MLLIKQHMVKFSIITITYNAEKVLERTIKSVIKQSSRDFEYIIIDGASKDNTLSIIDEYKEHIDTLISERDKGIYDAMNKGIKVAKGNFVWFMNAGDEIASPDILRNIISQMNSDTDLIYGDALFVNDNGVSRGLRSVITPHKLPKKLYWKDFRFGMLVCHQSFIASKSIISEYDIDNLSADLDYEINAVKKSKSQLYYNQPLAKYLEGGVSNQQLGRSLYDRFKVLKKHFGLIESVTSHLYIFGRGMKRIITKGKYW
ncbi:Glycosyltransferase involved in cell wall bisynthesis [Spirosomataceae bacterium TFI 002]|nr:Glycosyltransferase involved in cell wall bisynthesis [Spirosomataceae bacterium TFI 002]